MSNVLAKLSRAFAHDAPSVDTSSVELAREGPGSVLRRELDVGLLDDALDDVSREIFRRVGLQVLSLVNLDASCLPRRPMSRDQRPKRKRRDVYDAIDPAGDERYRDHREPKHREPTIHAAHEYRVALHGCPDTSDRPHSG
jgi:hypothetical protein